MWLGAILRRSRRKEMWSAPPTWAPFLFLVGLTLAAFSRMQEILASCKVSFLGRLNSLQWSGIPFAKCHVVPVHTVHVYPCPILHLVLYDSGQAQVFCSFPVPSHNITISSSSPKKILLLTVEPLRGLLWCLNTPVNACCGLPLILSVFTGRRHPGPFFIHLGQTAGLYLKAAALGPMPLLVRQVKRHL